MKKYCISVSEWDIRKQLFRFWYTSDGGFFLQDLLRLNKENKLCGISKYKTDNTFNGTRVVMPHYFATTQWDVKFTHHFDWNAHISWNWVLSGYGDDWTPKWASIKSFNLQEHNDWWPIFGFLFWWKYEDFRDKKENDIILTPEITDKFWYIEGKNVGIIVEWFYIPKYMIHWNNWKWSDFITFFSPVEGVRKLRLIPSLESSYGVIWLSCHYTKHDHTSAYWFAFSWAPWKIYDEHFCDNLSILYPYTKILDIKYQNLDYIT